MIIFKSKCIAFLMSSLFCTTLQDGVNQSPERHNCKVGMKKFFGINDLLLSARYSIKHYTIEDFLTNDTSEIEIFKHPRKYYHDLEAMNLVFSENIDTPEVFCPQQVDTQQEIKFCKRYLHRIFGTDKPAILHQALYNYRQAWEEEDINELPRNAIIVGSIGYLYLDMIASRVQVDVENETYKSPEAYCTNLFNPFY